MTHRLALRSMAEPARSPNRRRLPELSGGSADLPPTGRRPARRPGVPGAVPLSGRPQLPRLFDGPSDARRNAQPSRFDARTGFDTPTPFDTGPRSVAEPPRSPSRRRLPGLPWLFDRPPDARWAGAGFDTAARSEAAALFDADGPLPAAVLFDRDGTLVADVPYNGDPARVALMPSARAAVDTVRALGIPVGVVSNQSGVARGVLTRRQVEAVRHRVEELLGPFAVWAVCPHGPDDGCGCRKPAPGLVLAACERLGVDPARTVVIGDIGSDVLAARAAGARGVLVPTSATRPEEIAAADETAPGLIEAVRLALANRTPGGV
ncbi:D-glycero-alpha-D-manno-heptose-1,7-bisphosphate 7-phosphatase [Streptomyces sp. NPDC052236]|uniref:D-glycero-alpha-D-manno-heptose-1,7-bisphosphate 7-phosphatase n=1 Tax=Streptomyces sp. NPDC052236 TaxID=3365686 RepID=UPI0037D88E23